MPFTLAHPAIWLPFRHLRSNYVYWPALILGSMVPDFESLLLLNPRKEYSHTWPGLFYLDLPLGLLLLFLSDRYLRPAMVHNWPARYAPAQLLAKPARAGIGVTLSSLAAGSASHLLWDQGTHRHSGVPVLERTLRIGPFAQEIYLWLQYGCSLIGLAAVGFWLLQQPKILVPGPLLQRLPFWISACCCGSVSAALIAVLTPAPAGLKGIMTGLFTGLMISSVYYTAFILPRIKNTSNGKT